MISFILSVYTTETLPATPPIHTKSHTLNLLAFSVDNSVLTEMLEMSLREMAALIGVYLVPSGAQLIILSVVLTFDIKALFSV